MKRENIENGIFVNPNFGEFHNRNSIIGSEFIIKNSKSKTLWECLIINVYDEKESKRMGYIFK